jgi:glutathione S-transferase
VVFRIASYGLPLTRAAQAYQALMLDLPAMREWYAAAIAETWREAAHEQHIGNSGTIVADRRAG